jgi:hypothetical protein
MVVADHAEILGVPYRIMNGDPTLSATSTGKRWAEMMAAGKRLELFEKEFVGGQMTEGGIDEVNTPEIRAAAWDAIVDAAHRNNDPCAFTTFIGWEWTSNLDGKNLHRVVMTPAGRKEAEQFLPFSSLDSTRPEDLWDWLALTSTKTGADFIAIPHNSNVSGGLMFNDVESDGRPITAAYARTRMRWEPVVEVTQIKGDSETHPVLSPDDEFADFERFEHMLKEGGGEATVDVADYVRSGLLRGLQIEQAVGVNPYQVAMIGSTDSHAGLSSAEEDNFWGKTALDSTRWGATSPPRRRTRRPSF